ncbi:MAG: aminoacyl-tRNA hydrolase [Clostridiales bacterium]|nr:aminoacyl-tRNA hydrolase [Clostridiales bacterium]
MKLVVGLGNPGLKYLKNLHNIGFMAVELLAEKYGVSFNKKGFKGEYGEKNINGEKVIFLKPQTFMNLSGDCVQELSAFYKIPTQNILVIYDDLDIAIGYIRIRANGSAGTHNGMRSIVSRLGTTDFPRIRVGTKPEVDYEIIDYVLSDIRKEDKPRFRQSIRASVDAADYFINGAKIDDVMCKFNSFKPTV